MMDKEIEYVKKYLPNDRWEEAISLIENGVSPQYVVGNVNFGGYIINVDKRVLIPRFETELLVEKTKMYIKSLFKKRVEILEIGTGSGCIAIYLKKETNCNVVAVDVSSDALDVAKANASNNNVDIRFVCSNVFSNISGKFDVIISNPPYISYDEEIEDIVIDNEPHIALYASNDGLYYYDKILKDCSKYLNSNYLIAFDLGYRQGNRIKELAYKYLGKDIDVNVLKDYSDRDRFVFISNK